MRLKWNQGLKGASNEERQCLLEAEAYAEHCVVQAVVGALCALSPTGMVECRDVSATCVSRRWARDRASLYSQIKCVSSPSGARHSFNWRLSRMPRTRAISRPPRKRTLSHLTD
jgi:hypothetical protein